MNTTRSKQPQLPGPGILLGETHREREYRLAHHYLVAVPEDYTAARVSEYDFHAVPFLGQMWERAKTAKVGWSHVDLVRLNEWDTYKIQLDRLTSLEMFTQRSRIDHLESQVLEASALRLVVMDTRTAIDGIITGTMEREDMLGVLERGLARLRACGDEHWITLREAAHGVAKEAMEAQKSEQPLTVEMPLPSLDVHLGGWRRGRLHMIQAITSGHKTTLARMAAEHVASNLGQTSAYISLEDTPFDIAARSIASRSKKQLEVGSLVSGNFVDSPDGIRTMVGVISNLDETDPQLIIRHESLTISQCVARLHESASRGAVLAVIDFFQLIRPDSGGDYDQEFWLVAANRLQKAALDTNMALVLCVQPTQEATKRATQTNYMLGLGDMRGGSAIPQAAYGVLSLSFRLDDNGKRCKNELYIAPQKWKSAQTGKAMRFYVDGAFDTISEWDPPYAANEGG